VQTVTIHTDGGCQGNPGPGAWAAVLVSGSHRKEVCGAVPATTNNRMELRAAIGALEVLNRPCRIALYTDSNYLKDGISKWIHGWKRNGWKTATKEPVKNEDLWRRLDQALAPHTVEWRWLKGHAGHAENERCDQLATAAMAALRGRTSPAQLREALVRFKQGAGIEEDA
jgi:ribonuclease HI